MTGSVIFVEASQTGAGEVACRYARQQGYDVILLCREPDAYPQAISQHCQAIVKVDTSDLALMVEAVGALTEQSKIRAIITTSDFFVVQTAELAMRYGVPTNEPSVVRRFRNKFQMREAINRIAPSLNPAYRLVSRLEEAQEFAQEVGFPFIAKPVNGNDSLYVKKINGQAELDSYLQARQGWGRDASGQDFENGTLLEALVGGEEFCLDLLKPLNKKFIVMGAFRKIITKGDGTNFIKIGASFPSSDDETMLLFRHIAPVLKQLGFAVGAVNVDCKIVGGEVKILEVNPRLVGDQMGSHMIELATGENPAHAIVELAQGKSIEWNPSVNRGVAIHRVTMPEAGFFLGLENEHEMRSRPRVESVQVLGEINKWYEPAASNQGVIGSIIVSHESAEQAMMLAVSLARTAKVRLSKSRHEDTVHIATLSSN
ncbi:ATP-grasp domain-containing protein [Pseudomonas sp. Irchel s3a18]|uniref:ATP-grasp domain-containing protein n=1 Tax=Pseudomonas sp. Irchel s3a18 TaxID=2009053 RepID=UPI000BA4A552|nr:ATP-grasp domain-containing protein [Pseudomonas sp. Irchel s3a18]